MSNEEGYDDDLDLVPSRALALNGSPELRIDSIPVG